jgi:hypothetical protein
MRFQTEGERYKSKNFAGEIHIGPDRLVMRQPSENVTTCKYLAQSQKLTSHTMMLTKKHDYRSLYIVMQ